jgi:hypothetical protein
LRAAAANPRSNARNSVTWFSRGDRQTGAAYLYDIFSAGTHALEHGVEASLLVAVLADDMEEAAIEVARQEGVRGLTVLPARGLNYPEHVTFFGNTYLGLEVALLMVLDRVTAARIAERLNLELDLLKPFKGLAFCLPLEGVGGLDPDELRDHIEHNPPVDCLGRFARDDDA